MFEKFGTLRDYVKPEWKPSKPDALIALAGFNLAPLAAGLLIGFLCKNDTRTWYRNLKKASWSPPTIVFTIAYQVAYILLGTAGWLVWRHGGFEANTIEFGFYFAVIALLLTWPLLTFKGRKLDLALISDLSQLGLLSSTIYAFHSKEAVAAFSLIPVWALALFDVFHTFSLYNLNPQVSKRALSKPFKAILKHITSERRR